MALLDNRAKIQELIDAINAQPGGGSGGSGGNGGSGDSLPDGVLAISSGTITPSSDIKANHTIAHGLGTKPDFAVLMLCEDAETTVLTSAKILQFQAYKRIQDGSGTVCTARSHVIYLSATGALTPMNHTDTKDSLATTSEVTFYGTSTHPMKAGYTYRWVCGVLSDIQ